MWARILPLMASALILGCSPGGQPPARALSEPTPVRAEPLALLVLTPDNLIRHGISIYQRRTVTPIRLTMGSIPTATPVSGADTVKPSLIPTLMPPLVTLTSTSLTTATSTPILSIGQALSLGQAQSKEHAPTPSSTLPPTPRLSLTLSPTMPSRQPMANRPPDRIVASAIGLDAPVIEIGWHLVERDGQMVSEWDVADHAAGFHRGSAYPGHVGNTVLSGHHNIRGEVFRNLVELQSGDMISLYVDRQEYPYVVRQVLIIPEKYASPEQKQENVQWIGHFPEERLTLVTCWPYTSNTHRVIVVADPVGRGS